MSIPANLKSSAGKLKQEVPAILLAMKDPATPGIVRVLAAVTVCYALSPIDLIPDFIPVLGYLDDLILLPGLIALTVKQIPDDVLVRCRAEYSTKDTISKNYLCALPIAAVWIAVILWLIRRIF